MNNVRNARKLLKLSQEDLASRVGVSRQTIISIEKGGYSPSVTLAIKIAKSLKSTVEQLFDNQ